MLVIGTLIIICALPGVITSLLWISRSLDSEGWEVIDCTCVESEIEKKVIQNETSMFFFYRPKIRYIYQFKNLSFENNKVQFGFSVFDTRFFAEGLVEKYRKGQSYKLAVNPKHPKLSVLEVGIKPSYLIQFAYSFFFILVGLSFILYQ